MIPADTPYKVIKYLAKLSQERVLTKNHKGDKYIIHLIDRKFIDESPNSNTKFKTTDRFKNLFLKEIGPAFEKYNSFLRKHSILNLEHHCTIGELEQLILIEEEKPCDLSLQEILTKYYKSSKHTPTNSNLAKAIKFVLGIAEFPEENKDQQFLSILFPKNETRFIVLCENKNRLRIPRHDFIEFWYAGGKNTKQLQFIPKPRHPIFYLFDWDCDGIEIYLSIKQNYFTELKAFLPSNPKLLMVDQATVKNHHSKWKKNMFLANLNNDERSIVETLIENDSIIEEQRILLTEQNLVHNAIC
jgi:hypothetical protein